MSDFTWDNNDNDNNIDDGDDGFGDFSATPPIPNTTTNNNLDNNNSNDSDFGDFEATPSQLPSNQPEVKPIDNSITDNDDGFGSFSVNESNNNNSSINNNNNNNNSDNSDIGFDTIQQFKPQQQSNSIGNSLDLDFGDFETTPPLQSINFNINQQIKSDQSFQINNTSIESSSNKVLFEDDDLFSFTTSTSSPPPPIVQSSNNIINDLDFDFTSTTTAATNQSIEQPVAKESIVQNNVNDGFDDFISSPTLNSSNNNNNNSTNNQDNDFDFGLNEIVQSKEIEKPNEEPLQDSNTFNTENNNNDGFGDFSDNKVDKSAMTWNQDQNNNNNNNNNNNVQQNSSDGFDFGISEIPPPKEEEKPKEELFVTNNIESSDDGFEDFSDNKEVEKDITWNDNQNNNNNNNVSIEEAVDFNKDKDIPGDSNDDFGDFGDNEGIIDSGENKNTNNGLDLINEEKFVGGNVPEEKIEVEDIKLDVQEIKDIKNEDKSFETIEQKGGIEWDNTENKLSDDLNNSHSIIEDNSFIVDTQITLQSQEESNNQHTIEEFKSRPIVLSNVEESDLHQQESNKVQEFLKSQDEPKVEEEELKVDVTQNVDQSFEEFSNSSNNNNNNSNNQDDEFGDFDDFGDFKEPTATTKSKTTTTITNDIQIQNNIEENSNNQEDDEFGDFDDFKKPSDKKQESNKDDDFGDFGDFGEDNQDDDFGDFGNFAAPTKPVSNNTPNTFSTPSTPVKSTSFSPSTTTVTTTTARTTKEQVKESIVKFLSQPNSFSKIPDHLLHSTTVTESKDGTENDDNKKQIGSLEKLLRNSGVEKSIYEKSEQSSFNAPPPPFIVKGSKIEKDFIQSLHLNQESLDILEKIEQARITQPLQPITNYTTTGAYTPSPKLTSTTTTTSTTSSLDFIDNLSPTPTNPVSTVLSSTPNTTTTSKITIDQTPSTLLGVDTPKPPNIVQSSLNEVLAKIPDLTFMLSTTLRIPTKTKNTKFPTTPLVLNDHKI